MFDFFYNKHILFYIACSVNEKYESCPTSLCIPKTCDEAGYPLNCTINEYGAPCAGKPGCVCKDGYLRDVEGMCIPSDQCRKYNSKRFIEIIGNTQ